MSFDVEANSIRAQLPAGPRVVVIGSTSFHHQDSFKFCELIAAELAQRPDLVAVTGGVAGVGQVFAVTFAATRALASHPEKLFHLLPRFMGACRTGVTLQAGADFFDRREILGRLGDVYLMIEGGPGTEHEAQTAAAHGFAVIPLARTEGASAPYYKQLTARRAHESSDWALLADEASAAAATRLIGAALSHL
jgi:predicted Rossmann-fold nucleotide-binding protein